MNILEWVYERSPLFFQNLMTSVSGYEKNRTRYGAVYWQHRDFLKRFDTWTLEEQQSYQRDELIKLLRHAVERSPFYRELYQGINLDDIRSAEDLRRLPIVEKEMIRANIDRVITIPRRGAVEEHTGGTTGKSLIVLQRVEDSMRRMATLDHFKARVGFEHRVMRRATFNGKHIVPPRQKSRVYWRYNKACKQMIYSSFFITEDNIPYYLDSLRRFQPQALDGFFTCMLDIAGYLDRKGEKAGFTPLAIFPTSETVTMSGRILLEKIFGCKVYDQYASSEGAPFVCECPYQQLHVDLSSGIFEQINDSKEVLVTSFTTYGTPLIRYRIGDVMEFAPEGAACPCGLAAPMVTRIEGRKLDFLYTPEGAKVNAGNVANLLKNMPNAVIRAQFRQDSRDEITALLVVDKNHYKDEFDHLLRKEFEYKFGPKLQVKIAHVDEIPRESSGKFRMIVNNVQ